MADQITLAMKCFRNILVWCLFAIPIANWASEIDRTKVVETIRKAVASADEVVISDLEAPTVHQILIEDGVETLIDVTPAKTVTLTNGAQLAELRSAIKVTPEYNREGGEIYDEAGNTVTIYPPCLCYGDFELIFRAKEKESLRFTLHHEGAHIRVVTIGISGEYDLVGDSSERIVVLIRKALRRANPESSVSRSRHMTPVEQAPGRE